MPVILPPADYARWLDPDSKPDDLKKLLAPLADQELDAYPVSTRVNNPRNDGPECAEKAGNTP
jgi:putative SOS response-associated peptidase YedK